MAIGERIHFFRSKRGMTMKQLGQAVGFPENSADVRLAQYETGTRTPKADLTAALAEVLGVSPEALAVPDIDSYIGLMHTLFCLEDRYGLVIAEHDGEPVLQVDGKKGEDAAELHKMLSAWAEQAKKLKAGGTTQNEYDLLPETRHLADVGESSFAGVEQYLGRIIQGQAQRYVKRKELSDFNGNQIAFLLWI